RGRQGRTQTTNAVTFALVPDVRNPDLPDLGNSRVLRVPVKPRLRAGQQAALLLSDVELSLGTLTEDAKVLWVWCGGLDPAGPDGEKLIDARDRIKAENVRRKSDKYVLRLRVDGVDSLPFDPEKKALEYDTNFQKQLTP